MSNGQNASLSVGMDQILQLGEVTAKILYAIVESKKAELKKLDAKVPDAVKNLEADVNKEDGIELTDKNHKMSKSAENIIDSELLEKLDAAFNEFLLVSREVIQQTQEPVIDLKNVEQLIDPEPITREEKILAREINTLDQAVERTNKSLEQFSEAAQDSRIPRRTVIRSLGEKMIQIDDKRIQVAQGLDNYFSSVTNQARIGFATWMVNQFDGINSRFEQIKNVANQQIDEINRAEKKQPGLKSSRLEEVENIQTKTLTIDSKSPEIDKIRALLLTMENNMSDLTRAIHSISQEPTETRTLRNEVNPLHKNDSENVQTENPVKREDTQVQSENINMERVYHPDEFGLMLLDLHDGFDSDPQKLTDFIQFSTRFQQYSTKNQQLIFAQNADALQVANVQDLLESDLHVKEGANAIKVFVPNDNKEGPRFVMGSVYDISQTDHLEKEYPDVQISETLDNNPALADGIQAYCLNKITPNYNGLEGQLEAQGVTMMLLAHNNLMPSDEMKIKMSKTYQAYRSELHGSRSDQQKSLDATLKSMNKIYQEHVEELDQYLSYAPVNQTEGDLKQGLEEKQEDTWEQEM